MTAHSVCAVVARSGTSSLLDTVSTEVTNNLLTVLTCSDSFQTFIEVIDRFLVELNEAYPQNVQPIQGPDGCYVPDDTDEEDEKGHPAPAKDLASGKASPEFVPSAPVDIVGRSGGVVNELQSAMQDALAMTDPSLPSGPRSLPSALEYSYHGSSDDDDDDAKDAGVRMIDNYLQHLHLQQRRSKSQGHNRRHVPEQQARWFDDSVLDDAKALAASGPVIIDNHIQLPDEDDVSAEIKEIQDSIKDRSLKYPFPISETVLRDVNICWRMFGGSDWVREQKQSPAPASASASASASAKATAPSQEDVEVGTHIYRQSSVSHDYFSAGASPANDAPRSACRGCVCIELVVKWCLVVVISLVRARATRTRLATTTSHAVGAVSMWCLSGSSSSRRCVLRVIAPTSRSRGVQPSHSVTS